MHSTFAAAAVLASTGLRLLRPTVGASARCRSATASLPMASDYHVPVLLDEVMHWLVTDPAGTYADGTLGGGGHSAALLEALAPAGGRLIGLDRDPEALREAGARLQPYMESGHAQLVHSNFGAMPDALRGAGLTPGAGGGVIDGPGATSPGSVLALANGDVLLHLIRQLAYRMFWEP